MNVKYVKKTLLVLVAFLAAVTFVTTTTTNDVAAAKIALKGRYLYDRDGNRHQIPLSKKGNHTKAAQRVANVIVKTVGKKPGDTDLTRVDLAAYYISLFAKRDHYTMHGPYYNKAYGVFIARQYSCAGTADAMKMVLKKMGFKAKHVNKNKFTHQWCTLKMDGRRGYADGQVGFAGYGKYFTKKRKTLLVPKDSYLSQKANGKYQVIATIAKNITVPRSKLIDDK